MYTVKEKRLELGWSQSELGVHAGLGLSTINDIERGRPIRKTTLRLVAMALGVTPDSLTGIRIFNPVLHAEKIRAGKAARKLLVE